MNENSLNNKKFLLKMKVRKFSDNSFVSLYFQHKKANAKKFIPYDVFENGDKIRYRLNLETGEVEDYTRKLCEFSRGASIRRSKILINQLLEENNFEWFVTLTFDDFRVGDRNDFEKVYNAYVLFINNLKKQFPDVIYITFPEKHKLKEIIFGEYEIKTLDNCYHFHMLLGNCDIKKLGFENSGKVCCSWSTKNGIASKEYFEKTKNFHNLKETDGTTIYNVTNFKYGFSTASKIKDKAKTNTYVKKYVEKAFGTTDLWKKRFFYSRNLKRPYIFDKILGETNFVSDLEINNLFIDKVYEENKELMNKHFNKDFNVCQYSLPNKFLDEVLINEKDNMLIPIASDKVDRMFNLNNQLKMEDI